MKKVLILLTVLFVMGVTSSCGFDNEWISVDNPTSEAITISLDGGEAITIEAKECKRLEDIPKGEHIVKMGDVETIFTVDAGFYLNPTLDSYVYVKVPYGAIAVPDSLIKTIVIDKKKYVGPFELFEGAIALNQYIVNFGPSDPLKDEIESSHGGKLMTKVFRKADFIQFYKQEYR